MPRPCEASKPTQPAGLRLGRCARGTWSTSHNESREVRQMSVNVKFRDVRGTEAARSPAGPAPQPVAAHATQRVIMTVIGLAAAAHLAHQRSSYQHAIMI